MSKISNGALIAIAAIGILATILTAGLLTSNQTKNSSVITSDLNVGVYIDNACTTNCTRIDWGELAPNNSTTVTVWIRNSGTVPTTLSMTTDSWDPPDANAYLSLSWNREGYSLPVGSSASADFTLVVSENPGDLRTFSFNIVVTGTE